MRKRVLSLLLVLCLMFTLLPVLPVGAERSDTDIPYAVTGGYIYFDKATGTITDCDETVTSANIPAEIDGVAVTTIGGTAFDGCSNLTAVTIPNSVTEIDGHAFNGCSNLTAVTIPDSVTWIGNGAFEDCTSLTAVTIPGSVTAIGDDVFSGCTSLTAVTIPGSVTTIGDDVFSGCTSLTAVTIPDSVTTIGNRAFADCDSLTEVTIPNSVTWIGDAAFSRCGILKSIEVSSENPNYSSKNGVLFDKTQTILYQCPGGKVGAYVIPGSVTMIAHFAFGGCGSLTEVTIPNGVTWIRNAAFGDCTSLTAVTIPDSVTTIGESAFGGCNSLTKITIGDSVTTIGNWAFYNCTSLTAVYFQGDAPELGERVFSVFDQESGKDINNPNLTLYYIEGKSGWTTPTWNGYPTATWDGKTGDPVTPDDPKPDDPSTPTFTDVPANAWFAGAVDYAVENGLMNGMGNNQFQPNTSMTRGMLVTVLWRYAESPKQGENTFTDVPAGKYYTEAVAWAAANGIVNGVGDGKFNPDGNITREQLVTILYRYCKQLNIDTSKTDNLTGFPDAGNVGNSAKDAMRWAVAEKLIGGKTLDASGTVYLQPKGSATRAEVATILMRFIENILKK